MFTLGALLAGTLAAFVIGFSKTAVPGAALVAVPLLALVFEGRLIAGGTLPILLVADTFAVDVVRPARPLGRAPRARAVARLGYLVGIVFFVSVGAASRGLEMAIGAIVLGIVVLQIVRLLRGTPTPAVGVRAAALYGTTGGFTTFVANAAGPVVNTYLVAARLPKAEMVGTSAWLYLLLNVSKVPLYVALGAWTTGGAFFTADSLAFNALVAPGVIVGVYAGRWLFPRPARAGVPVDRARARARRPQPAGLRHRATPTC